MKIPEKLYQRGLSIWFAIGLTILSGYLLHRLMVTTFEYIYLLLGWLVLGLILLSVYAIIKLWDADLYYF